MTDPKPPVPSDMALRVVAFNRSLDQTATQAVWLAGYHARDAEVQQRAEIGDHNATVAVQLFARIAELEA